jgi:hypothetical protein
MVMRLRRAASMLALAALLAATMVGGAPGSDEIDAELVGFLAQLPPGGLRLPPAAIATAALEVPNEQGGPRIVFAVEFGPRTDVALRENAVRNGELVVIEGVLRPGRLRVRRIGDVDVVEFRGRAALPAGPLALPASADRLLDVVLDGASSLAVTFLITPRTTAPRTSLRDGQPVTLTVVTGRSLVVDLETAGPR